MNYVIIGAGGHGAVVRDCILAAGHEVIGYLDDFSENHHGALNVPIIGPSGNAAQFIEEGIAIALGIGNNAARMAHFVALDRHPGHLPFIRHPLSWVSPSAAIGLATVVVNGAMVNARATVGNACILNTSSSVDHDCRLGDGVHICPGARLGGNVTVGHRTFVGMGAVIREGITVGDDCLIAAGAVVVRDLAGGSRVAGVPARRMES